MFHLLRLLHVRMTLVREHVFNEIKKCRTDLQQLINKDLRAEGYNREAASVARNIKVS